MAPRRDALSTATPSEHRAAAPDRADRTDLARAALERVREIAEALGFPTPT
jgi:hypothetical protein